jgi:hypothetical protein
MGHQGIYTGQQFLALGIFENKQCHHLQAVNTKNPDKASQKQDSIS